jgi:pimeloyl-ACP methyl ester carboxylesterase
LLWEVILTTFRLRRFRSTVAAASFCSLPEIREVLIGIAAVSVCALAQTEGRIASFTGFLPMRAGYLSPREILVKNIESTRRPLFRRGGVVAGLAIVTGLAVAGGAVASAKSSVTADHLSGPRPTVVLVHGAWADSSSWAGVVRRLQRDGFTVDVPPDPLRGLAFDPAFLADFLHTISGPIVLVGHSYGGAVITNAATGNKQVKALVYVDAFAPDKGQTLGQLVSAVPGSCVAAADPTTVFNLVPFPGAPAGVFDAYVKQSLFPSCFANGLSTREARVLAATQEPLSTIALGQKSGVPAWKTIPSWAVVGTADRVILPSVQLAMARHAHAHITKVRAPHLSMISDPGVVTRVIVDAARGRLTTATGRPGVQPA